MDPKIEVLLIQSDDPLFGAVAGHDVIVRDDSATLADFLRALDEFAAQFLADCRGCDGCCQERAPLTALDIDALAGLLDDDPVFPAHAVCAAFAALSVDRNGATDITLRRGDDNACRNLDLAAHCCRIWPCRPFVCHSHFCLPRSERLEQLRQEIVNAGENELTRLLLAEESAGAPPLLTRPLVALLDPHDYEENPLRGRRRTDEVLLRDALSPALWRQLHDEV